MKSIILKNIAIIIIFVIAFALRVVRLDSLPPALTWDEAAWGYNAYSIGHDGRDEFGKFLPIQFIESFGDFKPPVYAYLTVFPVKIFGLNEFAVRFPSAIAGSFTVILSYFLIKKIIKDKEEFIFYKIPVNIPLLTAFFLAISPWHILLSRAAFEANVASFFIVLGVLLFFMSLEGRKIFLALSVVSLIVSAYTFNTARIVAPLLLGILFVSHLGKMIKFKEVILGVCILGFVLSFPLLLFLRSPQAKLRYQEVNIFSDIGVIERVNQEQQNNNNVWWSKIIDNRRFAYGVEYMKHYFDNLSPSFLFIKGDGNPKFSIQDVGQMYLWEIPFFIFGTLLLFRKREGVWWLVPLWIFIGIAPAATARETPHALRIASTLPMFQFLTAYGFMGVLSVVKKSHVKAAPFFFIGIIILILGNFIFFLHNYVFHYSREFSGEWQYGYKEAITTTELLKNNYSKIYFTQSLGRPYIYVLFYGKYPPENFRNSAIVEREALGFVTVRQFEKYVFAKDLSIYQNENGKNIYVDNPEHVPQNAHVIKEIKLLNGQTTLVIYEK